MIKTYRAKTFGSVEVYTEGREGAYPLDPRLDLRSFSPWGFAWGYNGPGPKQLALALLSDYLRRELVAEYADRNSVLLHQWFMADVLAPMNKDQPFLLTTPQIARWVDRYVGRVELSA